MKKSRYQIYQSERGFHWKLIAANGEPVAHGVEPFATLTSARRAIRSLRTAARTMEVSVVKETPVLAVEVPVVQDTPPAPVVPAPLQAEGVAQP